MTNAKKKRPMTSLKPCKLTPEQRAHAMQILETHFRRGSYERKYSEVQASQNYRVKFYSFRVMPTPAKIKDALRALQDIGYSVDVKKLAPTPLRAAESLVFMFRGVAENNNIKIANPMQTDGDTMFEVDKFNVARDTAVDWLNMNNIKYLSLKDKINKKGDLVILINGLKIKSRTDITLSEAIRKKGVDHISETKFKHHAGSKRVFNVKIVVPAPLSESQLGYEKPNRNININNGLPKDIKPGDIKPMSVVLVWFNDAPPTNVLVTAIDRPTSSNGRLSSKGEISYKGFDAKHNELRFESSQVLSLQPDIKLSELMQFPNAPLSKKAASVYARMLTKELMVGVESYHNRHEVVEGTHSCTDISPLEFKMLSRQPNLVKRLVMSPGCSPSWYLVHESNQHAIKYEVYIEYVNRPSDSIEF